MGRTEVFRGVAAASTEGYDVLGRDLVARPEWLAADHAQCVKCYRCSRWYGCTECTGSSGCALARARRGKAPEYLPSASLVLSIVAAVLTRRAGALSRGLATIANGLGLRAPALPARLVQAGVLIKIWPENMACASASQRLPKTSDPRPLFSALEGRDVVAVAVAVVGILPSVPVVQVFASVPGNAVVAARGGVPHLQRCIRVVVD